MRGGLRPAGGTLAAPAIRLAGVAVFFEILLVTAVVVITWFALYVLYRHLTDES